MSFHLKFPAEAYAAEALQRASYVFMAKVDVSLHREGSDWLCTLRTLDGKPIAPEIEREFRREVTDQELRLKIETRTEPLRTAILGLAFSRTGLQGSE